MAALGQVSLEDPKKALNEQYGGEDENSPPGTGFNTFRFTKFSNAYMLVYVRKSDWNQVRVMLHPQLRHWRSCDLLDLQGLPCTSARSNEVPHCCDCPSSTFTKKGQ